MLINNIPLSRLDCNDFTGIFKNIWINKYILLVFIERKFYLDFILVKKKKKMNMFSNAPFYIIFDESPDKCGRKIDNFLVGELPNFPVYKGPVYKNPLNSLTKFLKKSFI